MKYFKTKQLKSAPSQLRKDVNTSVYLLESQGGLRICNRSHEYVATGAKHWSMLFES